MLEHGTGTPSSQASAQAPSHRLDLQIDGVFDEEEARHLAGVLARVAPGQRVRVYFHRVRELHDRVMAMLAGELTAPYGRNIELVGLSRHHHRMLRYLTAR